jgi:hypothetical protein
MGAAVLVDPSKYSVWVIDTSLEVTGTIRKYVHPRQKTKYPLNASLLCRLRRRGCRTSI